MINTAFIWNKIAVCVPLFSAIMWFFILLIARYDSFAISERRIKQTLSWYYELFAFIWLCLFIYEYQPAMFVYLNSFAFAGSLLMTVTYYHFICRITTSDTQKKFPAGHYIAAVIAPGILFIWSFFIPFDVQEALVMGRGHLYSGQEAYSLLFLSKPLGLFIYGIIYCTASIKRLFFYYAAAKKKENSPVKLVGWIIMLMAITLALLLFTLLTLVIPRFQLASIEGLLALIVLSCGQHIVLGYNVIHRNFLLYMIKEEPPEEEKQNVEEEEAENLQKREYKRTSEIILSPQKRWAAPPMTKKRLGSFMRDKKPYLDPRMKITDLVIPLKTNRTTLSNFVNAEYGMNFNCYINSLRLKELNRLQKLPSKKNTELSKLLTKAGFTDLRHYQRTLAAEQKENKVRRKQNSKSKNGTNKNSSI